MMALGLEVDCGLVLDGLSDWTLMLASAGRKHVNANLRLLKR
jgi:hypothetical protein